MVCGLALPKAMVYVVPLYDLCVCDVPVILFFSLSSGCGEELIKTLLCKECADLCSAR